ncbi:hypothetical protein PMAYCL1PPCAC_00983, partial [Pristionchus mayeri]
ISRGTIMFSASTQPAAASTVPEQAPRRARDEPTEKRRRWIFIPHSSLASSLKSSEQAQIEEERREPVKRKTAPRSSSAFSLQPEPELIVPPEPYADKQSSAPKRALQSRTFPVLPSD